MKSAQNVNLKGQKTYRIKNSKNKIKPGSQALKEKHLKEDETSIKWEENKNKQDKYEKATLRRKNEEMSG